MAVVRRTKTKTRRKTRDLDQVHADLRSPKHLSQYQSLKPAEDLPGLGQWYCVECAKWFEGEHSLVQHRRGKIHKRRVRLLQEKPYTQKEAEAAIGLTTDNGKRAKLGVEATEGKGTQSEEMQRPQTSMTVSPLLEGQLTHHFEMVLPNENGDSLGKPMLRSRRDSPPSFGKELPVVKRAPIGHGRAKQER